MNENCVWNQPAQLTVGSILELKCDGQFVADEKFSIKGVKEEQNFELKLIGQKLSKDQALFQFSSYLVGKHEFKDLEMATALRAFKIPPNTFEVLTR